MFSVVSVLFLLDLSYLLFLCVEWCSFIALVSGWARVEVVLSCKYCGYLGNTPDVSIFFLRE